MSKIFEENIRLATEILNILNKGNFCRTDLMKLTLRKIGSPGKFNRVLIFLIKNGYIVKLGEPGTRTPYSITEAGRKQLEIWKRALYTCDPRQRHSFLK